MYKVKEAVIIYEKLAVECNEKTMKLAVEHITSNKVLAGIGFKCTANGYQRKLNELLKFADVEIKATLTGREMVDGKR
jgi:hypothetical protein